MTERDKKFLELARTVTGECRHQHDCLVEEHLAVSQCDHCHMAENIMQILRITAGPDVFKYPDPGKLTIDPCGAAYLKVLEGMPVERTVADVVGVNVDFSKEGFLIGVEFTIWPLKESS